MRTILLLNSIGSLGGAEHFLLDVLRVFAPYKKDVRFVLLCGSDGPLLDKAKTLGAETLVLELPRRVQSLGDWGLSSFTAPLQLANFAFSARSLKAYLKKLSRTIQNIDPDIIHSNSMKTHVLSALVGETRAKKIWYLHDFLSQRRIMKWCLPPLALKVDNILTNSHAVAEDCSTWIPRHRIQVVYNGVDTYRFHPKPVDENYFNSLTPLDLPAGVLKVGMLGTYARWKGQKLFLRAIHRLVRGWPHISAKFLIIGGPIYKTAGSQYSRAELERLSHQLHLKQYVGFVDFQDNPVDCFQNLDIVVHPSTRPEPFGRTVIEAMACERPIIASKEGGVMETVRHGVTGLLFTPRNSNDLASSLKQLIEDERLRERLGREGRHDVIQRFSFSRLVRDMAAAYGMDSVLETALLRSKDGETDHHRRNNRRRAG